MTHPSLQDRVIRLDSAVHHGGRRSAEPSMIILHNTQGYSALSTIKYLDTTKEKTSSYAYIIEDDGKIYRHCDPNLVAWHCGDSAWPKPIRATEKNQKPNGGKSLNAISIGIAFANNGEVIPDAALASAFWLCDLFMSLHEIPVTLVRGHYEVSPGRKTDPLPTLNMNDFRKQLTEYRA